MSQQVASRSSRAVHAAAVACDQVTHRGPQLVVRYPGFPQISLRPDAGAGTGDGRGDIIADAVRRDG
jgi:hypothetical protein